MDEQTYSAPSPIDPEVQRLADVTAAFTAMADDERARALSYVANRFGGVLAQQDAAAAPARRRRSGS